MLKRNLPASIVGALALSFAFGGIAHSADKGGPATTTDLSNAIPAAKGLKPYLLVFAGISAAYGEGHIGGFSNGGFDAAVLAGGAAGFRAPMNDVWFWGMEVSGERRLQSQDSSPFAPFVHGGDLRYTLGTDLTLGARLSQHTQAYVLGGYRWGWSDDVVAAKTHFNTPQKSGWETGIGVSHDLTANIAWDLRVVAWFPEDVNVGPGGILNLDGTDITARTGIRVGF